MTQAHDKLPRRAAPPKKAAATSTVALRVRRPHPQRKAKAEEPSAARRGKPVPQVVPATRRVGEERRDEPHEVWETETLELAAPEGPHVEEPSHDALLDSETEEHETETPEPAAGRTAARRQDDTPTSALSRYLREMARLPVMHPQEELENARRIEELELSTWDCLLESPTLVQEIFAACESALPPSPELTALRRRISTTTSRPVTKSRHATIRRLSEQLRHLDPDKLALREALDRTQLLLEQPPRGAARARASVARQATSVVQTYRRAENAKNDFVKANLRLVVCLAQRYNHGALPFADLVQEGNLGLMKAVDRFDHRRGYRFSTYATWWIRHAIQRALADKGRAIRLPVHLLDSRHRVTRWKRILEGRLGREPTAEELSAASGIVPEKLAALESVSMHQPISLDSPLGDEDDDRKLIDLVRDPTAAGRTVADDLGDRAMVQEMLAQLRKLKPVEADILRQRFGLDTGEEQTLAEIGQKYRLSRERIRQLQEQALGKLQQALRRKGLS